MTDKQKEQREKAYSRSNGKCYVCGKPLNYGAIQYAHRIANTKPNRNKWGSWIIDHTLNGEMVCSLSCNQSLNIGNNPGECLKLVADITLYEIRQFGGKNEK